MATPTLPQLHTPQEIADVFGCSEWWVKEQARRRRIPFTKVGGAYRFTAEHLDEIIRIFEERPDQRQAPSGSATPGRRRSHPQTSAPGIQLRARRPRRRRKAPGERPPEVADG